MVLGSIQTREQFVNSDLNNRYKQVVRQRLEDICLDQGECSREASDEDDDRATFQSQTYRSWLSGLFADVMFELDDGSVPAHKAILTARCDVMKAMFSGDFRESSAKVVSATNPLRNDLTRVKEICARINTFTIYNIVMRYFLSVNPYAALVIDHK